MDYVIPFLRFFQALLDKMQDVFPPMTRCMNKRGRYTAVHSSTLSGAKEFGRIVMLNGIVDAKSPCY